MRNISIALFLLVSSACSKFTSAQKPDTLYYSVVKGKTIAGYQKSWITNSNEHHYIYQYNDRGRGDSLVETVITTGVWITGSSTSGVDYYKKLHSASFKIHGDSATATVNEEIKTARYRNELYGGMETPGAIELMISAAKSQPGNTIQIFDGDSFEVRALHSKTFDIKGMPLRLQLAETYFGKNNPPAFFWLDTTGKFFAGVSDWFSTIRKGYEDITGSLNTTQSDQSLTFYSKQMNELSERSPEKLAVTNVRLFDAEKALMLENMTVTVDHGKIVQVGKAGAVMVPAGYTVVDGKGKTLMPGLWDMHGHYDKGEGLSYIAGGVTHVRDMGNSNSVTGVRDAIRKNEMLGPDISYLSGFIDQAGPFQGPTGTIVKDLQEGIAAVDEYASRGYGQIKLYSSIDPSWVKPMAAEAHAKGMRVAGHIPSFMTATEAINAGYDEITHINMIMLNFFGDTVDTRSTGRFYVTGERSKDIDINGKEANQFVQLMKDKKISFDPTMNAFAGMFTVFPGDTDAAYKPVVSWMPKAQRENVRATSAFAATEKKAAYISSFDNMMKMLKKIYDNGILIVSGTDGGEAFGLEHELELYVQAGMPPLNALQTSTWNAALDCKLTDEFGSLAPGKDADMILIDGNPGANISDIRRVEWVIKNDRKFSPKKLLGSTGWSYYY